MAKLVKIRGRQRKAYKLKDCPESIEWKHWKDPTITVGDWVKSDDDWVLLVKGIYHCKNSRGYLNHLVNTIGGNYSMEFNKSYKCANVLENRNNIGNAKRSGNRKPSYKEQRIADLIFEGTPLKAALNIVYPDYKDKNMLAKAIVKRKSFIRYLTMKAKDAFKNIDVDENFLAKEYKKLLEDAENERIRLDVLNQISKLTGFEDTAEKRSEEEGYIEIGDDMYEDPAELEEHKPETEKASIEDS